MPPKKETTTKTKATAVKRTVTRRRKQPTVSQEMIATRAYFLHLETGGDAFENWLQAERELVTV
jgi:Protein of unknown function (DUF2934)